MIESLRTLGAKRLFLLIFIFLIITDLAILLDIPILRQLLGFLFFSTIPGLLILRVLKLNRLRLTETIVLSVGLSISFLMFFGLLVDGALFALGYATPLSTTSLIISFSVILVILGIIGYRRNRDFAFRLPNLRLDIKEKTFLLLPAFFPLLCIFGMHLMNTTDNNIMLMALLFLLPAYTILVAVMHRRVPERAYLPIIFLTSISLVLMIALRSGHIIGMDSHTEYYLFQLTSNGEHWRIFLPGSTLSSCLSISLLPTIYQSLLNMNSEYLFKILYPLLFSISPLVIYVISKKYIGNFYAFLASFFFMSQSYFIHTAETTRTNMAVLFFALAIMVLFHDGISEINKRALFIILAVSTIVSHYSTAYVFFFILLLTWMGMWVLSKRTPYKRKPVASSGNPRAPQVTARSIPRPRLKKGITITTVTLFFVALFFWYAQVTTAPFESGVDFVRGTLVNLHQFFLLESRGGVVTGALRGSAYAYGVAQQIEIVFYWLTIALIAIGVLGTIARYKRRVASPHPGDEKTDFLRSKIDVEYFVLSLVCSALLVAAVVLPVVAKTYGIMRIYLQMLVVLAPFFVIGGITLFRFLKSRAYWLLLVVLIPYFMFITGTAYQVLGYHRAIALNSEGFVYDLLYVYDEETYAAKWLRESGELGDVELYSSGGGYIGSNAVSTDTGEIGRLVSQGGIPPAYVDRWFLFDPNIKIGGYIYLRYYNVVNGKILTPLLEEHDIAEYQGRFVGKAKIYDNGGSEIYK